MRILDNRIYKVKKNITCVLPDVVGVVVGVVIVRIVHFKPRKHIWGMSRYVRILQMKPVGV